VVVTGNHFIIDGVVAYILLAAAVGVTCLFPSQRPLRWSRVIRSADPGMTEVRAPHDAEESTVVHVHHGPLDD
jgi:hypothetical protein